MDRDLLADLALLLAVAGFVGTAMIGRPLARALYPVLILWPMLVLWPASPR